MTVRHLTMAVLVGAISVGSGMAALQAQEGGAGTKPAPATTDGNAGGGDRGNRGGGGGGGGGGDRGGDWRERMNEMTKTGLGATEEEWKVFQPKIEKVRTLQMQSRVGGMGGFGRGGRGGGQGGGGGGGQGAQGASDRPQTDLEKASQELKTALEDKAASADVIKAKLEGLRKARTKAREELAAAQKDLREIASPRQEAYLVSTGTLD